MTQDTHAQEVDVVIIDGDDEAIEDQPTGKKGALCSGSSDSKRS